MRTILSEYSYLLISWDDDLQSIIMDWRGGFIRGENIRQGLDAGLMWLEKYHGLKWLGNTREMGVFTADTQKWINEDWFPRFLQTKVIKMAVVVPADTLAKMSVDSVMQTFKGDGLETRYFDCLRSAYQWLKDE